MSTGMNIRRTSRLRRFGKALWKTIAASALLAGAATHPAIAAQKSFTYTYTDPQGSVIALADTAGHIIERFDYRPYGAQAEGAPLEGPGYTGHVHDREAGLIYMQARYYDPLTGRFLSPDPAGVKPGSPASFNRYSYANGNPLTLIDPDGREAACVSANRPCIPKDADVVGVNKALVSFVVPGGDLGICAVEGCSGADWAMAGAAIVPVGKIGTAGAKAVSKAARVIENAAKGRRGEEVVRSTVAIGKKEMVKIDGRRRFPDGLTKNTLTEIKNTMNVYNTKQIKDYVAIAKRDNLQFNLITNEHTKISKKVQEYIDSGEIEHIRMKMD